MVETRRSSLLLASNKTLVDSYGSSSKPSSIDQNPKFVRFTAGILRFFNGEALERAESSEESFIVGVSVSLLKRLAIFAGSLVLVKNAGTNVGRIAKVVVLDPPDPDERQKERTSEMSSPLCSHYVMNTFPSFTYLSRDRRLSHQEVVYVTPLLGFNIGLHISCLNALLKGGQESLKSLFEVEEDKAVQKAINHSVVHVELARWSHMGHLPRYASHLRISFVKVPECGILGSLKGSSKYDEDDRQFMIDSALNEYFKVDRFLARGDIFFIHINWNCGSEMCIACSRDA